MTNKGLAAPRQSRGPPCPVPPKIPTDNRHLWKNIKDKGKDIMIDPRILHHLPAICDSGISWTQQRVCVFRRPSMNLSNRFGAYANFSNNSLGQRFHSLDKLHDKKTLFVLSLLSHNLFDFLYRKTASNQPLKKKDDLSFFSYDLKQITCLQDQRPNGPNKLPWWRTAFPPKK